MVLHLGAYLLGGSWKTTEEDEVALFGEPAVVEVDFRAVLHEQLQRLGSSGWDVHELWLHVGVEHESLH